MNDINLCDFLSENYKVIKTHNASILMSSAIQEGLSFNDCFDWSEFDNIEKIYKELYKDDEISLRQLDEDYAFILNDAVVSFLKAKGKKALNEDRMFILLSLYDKRKSVCERYDLWDYVRELV